MVKIGKTNITSESRFENYVSKYSLKGFEISHDYQVDAGLLNKIESRAHKIVADKRFSTDTGARELFLCSLDEAVNAVEKQLKMQKSMTSLQSKKYN